jgi:hypothetical protein
LRNIAIWIKGDVVLASANRKRPAPIKAAKSSAMLIRPKLPRPVVIASA